MNQVILDALYFVAQKDWTDAPQSYFISLVTFLGESLGADYALVDELMEDGTTANTVGLYAKGSVVPNLQYSLAGTPCENVIGQSLCCYVRGIQHLFPQDQMLVDMGAESYVGVPLWDSTGRPSGLIAVIWCAPLSADSRQAAEAVLQIVALRCAHELDSMRHESRLREYGALLHSLADGFYFADCKGRFLDVNPAYSKMTGYDVNVLLTMTVHDLEPEETKDDSARHLAHVIECGQDRFETRIRRRDGTIIDVEISAQYWTSKGGRFAVTTRDISNRKQAERERAALEMQLSHAHKLEAVGRLAGGVAHDFNNMLAVILGQTELLLDDPTLSTNTREDLLEVRGAAERSAALTSQLLAFARKQPASPKILDLNAAVERLLKILRRLIGEHILLEWVPMPNLWNVSIDPSQFDQLLVNLCVNARDAIEGGGVLAISTHQGLFRSTTTDADSLELSQPSMVAQFVCLTVSDTGSGMDEETQKHIFEPFFSTKGANCGTGLGLATVYGVVKQNGGFIEVDSAPGKGSTFRLYFPRCTVEHSAARFEPLPQPLRTVEKTILLVEDEPRVMRIIATMLEKLQYRVLTAATPLEALQIAELKTDSIDLLLTDVVMPGMNGKQLHQRMQERLPDLRCLYMSGYNAEVVAHEGVLDDGIFFLQKPFKPDQLEAAVQAALASASRQAK